LDNADSKEARDAVKQLLSDLAGGRFLVTSRREDWPRATARKLPLKVFNSSEAVACLRSRYWKADPTDEERADFERLADELGHLPLGLTLASSYMELRRITPGRYLEDWKQKHQKLLTFVGNDDEPNRSLLAAFNVSYEQLSPAAVILLHQLAWLAPAPFPRRCVEDSQVLSTVPGADVSDVLAELQLLSLLERDEHSLSMHRLVLACARAVMSEDEARRAALSSALEWLAATLPETEYDPEGWRLWVGLSPHLDSVVEATKALQVEGQPLARICGQYGAWHYLQARFNLAEPLMRRALAIDERSYGQEHPEVARDLNNLTQLLQATNRLAEAEPLLARSLVILLKSTRLTGHIHPHLQVVFSNYIALLTNTARSSEEIPERIGALGRAAGFDVNDYRRVLQQVFE
jgi:hypothetical protein